MNFDESEKFDEDKYNRLWGQIKKNCSDFSDLLIKYGKEFDFKFGYRNNNVNDETCGFFKIKQPNGIVIVRISEDENLYFDFELKEGESSK